MGRDSGRWRRVKFRRYDIHWVSLDPTRGGEMRKTRPAVIVSLDVLNQGLKTVVVCPLTTQLHSDWRSRLTIKLRGRFAEIAGDQIRTVSKSRFGKRIGALSLKDAAALRRLLGEMYGAD
ncbi:MAG TPA: type II toxin-antitoxin system PemK/MazF family toxin [Chthoniobacterales bacterium]|nr:type II toxin-antitoxin system PemK/MazF family toxin [Chthoniobacterales bacterium]